MRFFAQADEVFDGNKPARETEDHVDRNEASQLKPGKGRSIDAEPQRLTHNDIWFNRLLSGKTFVKKVNDWQDSAGERHENQNEKSPAGPDVRESLCDDVVQTTPADKHQHQGRKQIGFMVGYIHRCNYTRWMKVDSRLEIRAGRLDIGW